MSIERTVLVTGARGFIGRNLAARLSQQRNVRVIEFGSENNQDQLRAGVAQSDVVFHLAGINRPDDPADFVKNTDCTVALCEAIRDAGTRSKVVMTSSIQAEQHNPYGHSKKAAENALITFSKETETDVACFRLKNVFGKWCRPNYNSVVATFCHNVSRDLPIQINDPDAVLELVYIDDVVDALLAEGQRPGSPLLITEDRIPAHSISLGDLAGQLQSYSEMQETLLVADFSVRFNQQLYATYLSHVEPSRLEYGLTVRSDDRGNLAEFIKSQAFGQIFVSRTRPGVTRGNHFHNTKTEKFFVIEGEAVISLRQIGSDEVIRHHVCGREYRIVDIPPGYTHSITNVGSGEMITLFWASEIFDPDCPDTYYLPVESGPIQSANPTAEVAK